MAVKTSCRALVMSMATQTGASCAITIPVTVGLLCGVVCCKNHCRDLRRGDDHLLRYLGAAQAVIASQPASFRRCYGPEYVSGFLKTWAATRGIHIEDIQPDKLQQNAYIERYNRTVRHEWLDQSIFETIQEAQDQATKCPWSDNNDRPNMAIGGHTPARKLNQYQMAA